MTFSIKSTSIKPSDIIGSKQFDAAKLIAFDKDGCILILSTENGLSLPCDQPYMDDRDALDTIHRIAWSFANVTLGTIIQLNSIDLTDTDGTTHSSLIAAARIAHQDPMRDNQYTRLFLSPNEFARHYSNEAETIQRAVRKAVENISRFKPSSFPKQVGA